MDCLEGHQDSIITFLFSTKWRKPWTKFLVFPYKFHYKYTDEDNSKSFSSSQNTTHIAILTKVFTTSKIYKVLQESVISSSSKSLPSVLV